MFVYGYELFSKYYLANPIHRRHCTGERRCGSVQKRGAFLPSIACVGVRKSVGRVSRLLFVVLVRRVWDFGVIGKGKGRNSDASVQDRVPFVVVRIFLAICWTSLIEMWKL